MEAGRGSRKQEASVDMSVLLTRPLGVSMVMVSRAGCTLCHSPTLQPKFIKKSVQGRPGRMCLLPGERIRPEHDPEVRIIKSFSQSVSQSVTPINRSISSKQPNVDIMRLAVLPFVLFVLAQPGNLRLFPKCQQEESQGLTFQPYYFAAVVTRARTC